jgi:hypothetical protein
MIEKQQKKTVQETELKIAQKLQKTNYHRMW